MTEKDLLLAIDNGTQSLKALIFDLEGRLLAKALVPFTPYYTKNPGWAEQDPEVFWQALCRACQDLWQQNEVNKDRIAGVAITTQRGTVVNVDVVLMPEPSTGLLVVLGACLILASRRTVTVRTPEFRRRTGWRREHSPLNASHACIPYPRYGVPPATPQGGGGGDVSI